MMSRMRNDMDACSEVYPKGALFWAGQPVKRARQMKEKTVKRRTVMMMVMAMTLVTTTGFAQTQGKDDRKESDRLADAAVVLKEIFGMPDSIPQDLLDKAECAIVFPSVIKVAVGIGGSYGRGAIVCRTGAGFDGPWGAPAMFALEGASIGFQLGGQATDFVLLVMNDRGATSVLSSKVKIGADASAAAGPKGRNAGASTDIVMRAEMLTYSRSRGLFAGISLEGSTLRADNDANERLYGRRVDARDIVSKEPVPTAGRALVDLLNQRSPKNLSERPK
jgi:SH3 domain-containing YSC84-like protein 1